jgi:hypothetical protein
MKTTLEELEAIVRHRICSLCRERTTEGACGVEQPESCSLFTLFPLVAQAILATEGEDIEACVRAIHENVCSVCIDQRLDGTCPQRDEQRCALDAHMPEVIAAIEEALGRPLRPGRATVAPAR